MLKKCAKASKTRQYSSLPRQCKSVGSNELLPTKRIRLLPKQKMGIERLENRFLTGFNPSLK